MTYKIFDNTQIVFPDQFKFITYSEYDKAYHNCDEDDLGFTKENLKRIEDKLKTKFDTKSPYGKDMSHFHGTQQVIVSLYKKTGRWELQGNQHIDMAIISTGDEYYYISVNYLIDNIMDSKYGEGTTTLVPSHKSMYIECDGTEGILLAIDKIIEIYDGIKRVFIEGVGYIPSLPWEFNGKSV